MNTERPKAIVFSCYINGLSIIRSLGRRGVPVIAIDYQRNAIGFSSKYVKESILAPDPRVNEDEFISFMLENSRQWKGSILIPTQDFELATFSRYKDALSKYYLLPVPDWESTSKIVDKKYTYELAMKLGIPIPKTVCVNSLESLNNFKNEIEYPCLLKPCKGGDFYKEFEMKAFIINSFSQLREKITQAHQAGCEMMIQEIIPGTDNQFYEYVAYYDSQSKPLSEFGWRKLRQSPPFLGVGRVGESICAEKIIDASQKMLSNLSFIGLCEIEFKKDPRDNKFKLLDINGRSTMQMGLPMKCGVDFPWIMYNDLVWNRKIHIERYDIGVKWIHAVRDIPALFIFHKQEKYTLTEYLSPYFSRKTFATFSLDDIKPTLREVLNIILSIRKYLKYFKLPTGTSWR